MKYFQIKIELDDLQQKIKSLQSSIVEMHPAIEELAEEMTWPVGSQPTSKPLNRFDVLQWDYFTENNFYPESDFGSVKDLTGADREDIKVKKSLHFIKVSNLNVYVSACHEC